MACIRIAVCEDEPVICSQIQELLEQTAEDLNAVCRIDSFYTGETLCEEIEHEGYDLIFLDIELPKMNGIDVARYIRETLGDEIMQIAYVSAKQEYAMELFEYRPINFLLKPLDKTKMKKVLEKYLKITRQNEQIFTYKKRFEVYHVPLSDILYFESKGRKVTIAARNGKDEFYGTLKEIKERIQDRCFLWIHKSILVNYRYIAKLKYDQAEMTDGAILQISQSRRVEIRRRYMEILEEEER